MKTNTKKATAIAVAAVMACGIFAGCDLVITNETENLNQTVATVNIKSSAGFNKEFGDLNKELVDKVISTASVSKRDMIVSFLSSGYANSNLSGVSYEQIFNSIAERLSQRQLYIQYAKAYFLNYGWTDEDDNPVVYNDLSAFNAYVKDDKGSELTGIKYDIAALGYFLTQEEKDKADYTTRVMMNNSIDSLEDQYIKEKEDDKEYDSEVRTTPTGIDTTDSDYYDPNYTVYTGMGKQSGVHVYEPKDGSTATTRLRAYTEFLTGLQRNDLVQNGEDTSDIETLNYFLIEKKSDYEDALIQKLADVFAKEAENKIDKEYCDKHFAQILDTQRSKYAASSSTLESAMNSVSDTNFVLTATGNSAEESAYGFVINILLPFSAAQSDELSSVNQDFGDEKGNKFATRAALLKNLKATDQRGSWFRGETDHSFKATAGMDAFGYNTDTEKPREYLFFENSLKNENPDGNTKYERLKNYLGKYTYNGVWNEETRKYKPYQITIDDFIGEMEGYLSSDAALGAGKLQTLTSTPSDYYNPVDGYYYQADGANGIKKGDVDYSKFVYYEGQVIFDGGFNANEMFNPESDENKALSVINELSFAYNTDTGGLNSYLGYAVTANKTNFVSEFEYAAQKVVLAGAGNYIVVPSDYGWHVIYCTFSFVDAGFGATGEIKTPFKFDYGKIEEEGTFSNLFYESIKAETASSESTNRLSKIISAYTDSYEIFKNRYSDLTSINQNA